MSGEEREPAGHDWFDWSPIGARPPAALPGDSRLAFAIVVSVEYYEMQPRPGSVLPASLPGGFGRGPYPDFRTFSHREYGNRVGIFRVMDVLERQGLRATAAIDAVSARERRVIVEECLKRRWEIAAHGEAVNRLLSSRLTDEEERAQIAASLEAIERASGVRPSGWHGAEYGESERTPALLAQAGIKYVLDWPNDELPYAMRTTHGPLIAVPMLVDFDDVFAHWQRKLSMARWQRSIAEGVDRLLEDGRTVPRVLVLNLHPWLIGQAWRIGYLDDILQDMRRRKGIWFATAGEIAAWYAASSART